MEFLDKMISSSATSASSLPSESQATGAAAAAAATATTKIFDVISCNTVMAAFAQRGLYNETLDLLRKMQQSQEQEKRPTDSDKNGSTTNQYAYPAPDTISYNSCLYALARSSSSSSFSSSRSSYKHKSKQSSNYGDERRQNHLTATAAAIEAEKVLNNMSNDPNVDPDTLSYNTVLYAWSNAASDTEEGGDHNEMVVSALKAAQRADELLTTMEELADRQSEKRSTVTNKTNRKSNRIQKQSTDIEPDQYSYTTVMQAYAKAQRPDRARDVLERMIQRGVQPNRHVCTALMSAWSKSGQVEEAQRMLYQLMDDYEVAGHSEYKPDTAAFSSVIDGWAKVSNADRPEAATYAVELLEQMKEWADIKYGDDTFRPNAQTYTSVMTALAKSCAWDACEKVRAILEDLEDEYNQSTSILTAKNGQGSHTNDGLVDDKYSTVVRPTNIHYNALLLAFARSPHENKAHLAYNTFKMMQQHQRPDCRPDTISYNTLLLACANTSDKEMKQEALKIAVEAFRSIVQETKRKEDDDINSKRGNHSQFRSSIQATSTTFNHFLKTSRLSISSKDQLASVVSKTIQICCEMGMMNHLIVHQAQLACKTKKEWEDIAGELHVYVPWKADFKNSCSNVPAKWKKNARR
jgi:pentatricopeptide repeat protein